MNDFDYKKHPRGYLLPDECGKQTTGWQNSVRSKNQILYPITDSVQRKYKAFYNINSLYLEQLIFSYIGVPLIEDDISNGKLIELQFTQ